MATPAGTTPASVRPAASCTRGPGGRFDQGRRHRGGAPDRGRSRGQQRGRYCHAAAGQTPPQLLAGPRQPGEDRPLRAAEPPGRRLVRHALQVAEHDRRSIPLRQPVDLLEQGLGLFRLSPGGSASGVCPASCARRRAASTPGLGGHPPGDPEEPARHRVPPPDRPARGPAPGTSPGTHPRRPADPARTCRQTRKTIAPCRCISSSKPASAVVPVPSTNRSRSCPSVRSPMVPTPYKVWRSLQRTGSAVRLVINAAPSILVPQ